ncbi:hypothetical protein BIY24_04450 [Halobacteriovorax marinus]|nr:hypothetical protein BIY24_04450 [Halobacteriovorax marinus]
MKLKHFKFVNFFFLYTLFKTHWINLSCVRGFFYILYGELVLKILVTGFEPFGDISSNCTQMIVDKFKSESLVDTLILPVVTTKCFTVLETFLAGKEYDFIILLGQASKRDRISIERVALNVLDFPIADNEGNLIAHKKIIENASDGIFTGLPLEELQRTCKEKSIQAEVSNSAGTYICNEIFFRTLFKFRNSRTKVGFIHLPLVLEQNISSNRVNITLNDLYQNLKIVLGSLDK